MLMETKQTRAARCRHVDIQTTQKSLLQYNRTHNSSSWWPLWQARLMTVFCPSPASSRDSDSRLFVLLLCAILTSCPHFTESPEQMFAEYVSAKPRRSSKCTLLHVAALRLFGLDFSIPLVLERCAHGPVCFRHKNHFVGFRKASRFGWSQMEMVPTSHEKRAGCHKNRWKCPQVSLKKSARCDSNCGRLFGSLIGLQKR